HTGELVAGTMGSEARMEYTVIGETVTTADRMCTSAEPDEVSISEATYRQIEGTGVQVIDRGMVRIRGKGEPVHVYTVASAS
ncbi:MAG: adenylate/guanylate cyclase domain-containing protein, partial [Chloroflexota bacterium]